MRYVGSTSTTIDEQFYAMDRVHVNSKQSESIKIVLMNHVHDNNTMYAYHTNFACPLSFVQLICVADVWWYWVCCCFSIASKSTCTIRTDTRIHTEASHIAVQRAAIEYHTHTHITTHLYNYIPHAHDQYKRISSSFSFYKMNSLFCVLSVHLYLFGPFELHLVVHGRYVRLQYHPLTLCQWQSLIPNSK